MTNSYGNLLTIRAHERAQIVDVLGTAQPLRRSPCCAPDVITPLNHSMMCREIRPKYFLNKLITIGATDHRVQRLDHPRNTKDIEAIDKLSLILFYGEPAVIREPPAVRLSQLHQEVETPARRSVAS